jgi:FtsP/CotA-like multicopper oxidase with cupredoxin domain
VLLATHLWEGEWVSMQDIRKGAPPDNGLEVMYHSATLGDRMLGHGDPIRVKEGERVLFRLLNASASMGTTLALPGHRFTVIALDGNPVPTQTAVDVLWLGRCRAESDLCTVVRLQNLYRVDAGALAGHRR